jgi:GTP-binding protein
LESWDSRISTGQAEQVPQGVVAATPPPCAGVSKPRILSPPGHRAATRVRVVHTRAFWEAGYRRFLERRLRETFGFEGSPIRINVRVREKRGARSR